MNKNMLFFWSSSLIIVLTAFALIGWRSSEPQAYKEPVKLYYVIDSKYGATVTKEQLKRAISVEDLVPAEARWSEFPIHSVQVTLLGNGPEESATGDGKMLDPIQLALLRTLDYSESFRLIAPFKNEHGALDEEAYRLTYFITVKPENEAEYPGGRSALIQYLRDNSQEQAALVEHDRLERGSVIFTVDRTGTVTNVHLSSTSGCDPLDKAMIELIGSTSTKWTPATDMQGKTVNQELVLTFGRDGC